MKIAFACPHCGKQLVADSALAGRTGRCRYCGQRTVVPDGQRESPARAPAANWQTAVASQLVTPADRGAAAAGRADANSAADTSSGYKLRPVTPVGVPALVASEWDNAELGPAVDSSLASVFTAPASGAKSPARGVKSPARAATSPASATKSPSTVATPQATVFGPLAGVLAPLAAVFAPLAGRPVPNGATSAVVAYRTFFGLLGRLTTWISETSYTVSFIIIILAVASGMIGRHSLATLGCGAVVFLNLVGLAGDMTSLVTLSFRKNPLRGALFLVPPFTLYYLWTDWHRYRDTVVRMRIPLVTLALVIAAYLYVPWLRGGIKAEVPAVESVERAVDTVEEKLAGRKGALDEGLKKARSWLREVPLPDSSSLPGLPGTHQPLPGTKPPHPQEGPHP